MVEFSHDLLIKDQPAHHARDIIVSRIGFSLLSKSLTVMKSGTMTGDAAQKIFDLWHHNFNTHAEVINHSHRVAQVAVAIAEDRRIGLSEESIQLIALAGLAHDLGKIECTEYMSSLAEDDSKDIARLRTSSSKKEREKILEELIKRKKQWDEYEKQYVFHSIESAGMILRQMP